MEASLLAGLNSAQRAAVISPSTVLQVLAPPGSGKTKTLTTRVAYLLTHHGYSPQNIICCTFTIKAAREMRERLQSLVGCELEASLVLGTFHSICRRYLAAYGQLIGVQKGFGVADSSDSMSIVKKICKKGDHRIEPKTARARISSHKAKNRRVFDLPRSSKHAEHQEFRRIYEEYESALANSNLLDYDDLLLRCLDLLETHPTCVSNIEAVLIDEFQDTNVVQFELMRLFASAKRRITIVGDPDQSIYGFRSAEIENLVRMKTHYPETVIINLEENYRSSSAVLKLAQDVIEQDEARPDKKLKSTHCYGTLPVLRRLPNPHEEALWITAEIKRMLRMTGGMLEHSDIAVLIRSAYLSLLIEKSFTNSGIPYRMVGGMKFFDRAEIRLIIEYLRTVSHPQNDPALLSIINVPSRKIGDVTIASLVSLAEEKGISIWEVIQKVLKGGLRIEKKMATASEQDLRKLINIINDARKKMASTPPVDVPSTLIDFIVAKLCLPAYLQKKYKDDYEDRIENISEFLAHAKDVAVMSLGEQLPVVDDVEQQEVDGSQEALDQFLANIILSTEVENKDKKAEDKPRVTISTIHSAKGLEWPVVFVPAVYEGSIPHSRAEEVDEERRLLYVAMTRAQALLTLTFPIAQSRDQGDSVLSPFLPESIHKRLRDRGPVFNDEVVADIATILRRDRPSQEALTKGLQSMRENESAEDNIWPIDGTYRNQTEMQSLLLVPGRSLQEAEKIAKNAYHRSGSASVTSWNSTYNVGITMRNTASFSTSNITMGFTTASYQLQNAPPPSLPRSISNPEPQKKPKLQKAKSAQGNIVSFFSKPAQTTQEPATASEHLISHFKPDLIRCAEPLVPPRSGSQRADSTIPSELSFHHLSASANIHPHSAVTGYKRPRPALEPSSPNSRRTKHKQYVFISSSPPSEEKDVSVLGEAVDIDDGDGGGDRDESGVGKEDEEQLHPASLSLNTGVTATSLKGQALVGKKTLGVRRAMGGWDARKNR